VDNALRCLVPLSGAEGIGEFGDFLKFSLHLLGNFFACWFSHIFTLVNLVVYVWQTKQHILSKEDCFRYVREVYSWLKKVKSHYITLNSLLVYFLEMSIRPNLVLKKRL